MRRSLEIWESLQDKELNSLHMSLLTPGVNKLICSDYNTLWALAGQERQEDLQLVARRVAVLGLRCVDSRLQCLISIIQNVGAGGPASSDADVENLEATPQETDNIFKFFREQIDAINNLKWEMEALQLLHARIRVHGETHKIADVAEQEEVVRKVQFHCIWSQELDLIVRLLVMMVAMLRKRILFMFGPMLNTNVLAPQSLGKFGLSLHYAHVIIFIEKIVHFPSMVMGSSREDLYAMLPRDVQSGLRKRLRKRNGRPMDADLESKLKRSMNLLPPLAHNTLSWQSAHTPGSNYFPKHVVFRVQTLEFAQKDAVNEVMIDALAALCCICGDPLPLFPPFLPKSFSHSRTSATTNSSDRTRNVDINNGMSVPPSMKKLSQLPGHHMGRLSYDGREQWRGGDVMGNEKGNVGHGYKPPPSALPSPALRNRRNNSHVQFRSVPSNLDAPIRIHVEDANGVDWSNAFNEAEAGRGKGVTEQEGVQEKKEDSINHKEDVSEGGKRERGERKEEGLEKKAAGPTPFSNTSTDGKENVVKKLSFGDDVAEDGNLPREDAMNKQEEVSDDVSPIRDEDWNDDADAIPKSMVMDSLSLFVKESVSKSKVELSSHLSSKDWNKMVKGMMEKMEGSHLADPPPLPSLMPASMVKSKQEVHGEKEEKGKENEKGKMLAAGADKSWKSNNGTVGAERTERTEGKKKGGGEKEKSDGKEERGESVTNMEDIGDGLRNSAMDSPPLSKENEIKKEWLTISSAINQVKQQKKFPTSAYERPWKYLPSTSLTSNAGTDQNNDPSYAGAANDFRGSLKNIARSKSVAASWSESQFRELKRTSSQRPANRSIDFSNLNGGNVNNPSSYGNTYNNINNNNNIDTRDNTSLRSGYNESISAMRRSDRQVDFGGMGRASVDDSEVRGGSYTQARGIIRPNERIGQVRSILNRSSSGRVPSSNRAGFR